MVLGDLRVEEHFFIYASRFFLVQLNSATVLGDHRSDALRISGQVPSIAVGSIPATDAGVPR